MEVFDLENVTIKDVAKYAQVSIATVSRVLNDNYPVSKETKEKVLKAMNELNFKPNSIARSLKSNITHLIGVVLPDISNSFFMEIIKGIDSVVSKEEYSLILSYTDENFERELNVLKRLSQKRVDAIILASSNTDNKYVDDLIKENIPVVLIDRKIKNSNVDVIVSDDFGSSYMLTKYLIEMGHKDICIVNGNLNVSTGIERYEGFKAAMMDHNIEIKDDFILNGYYSWEKAYERVKKLITDKKKIPTAIFAANNRMAEGAMLVLKENHLKIPDDVSLVTFEEIENQKLIEPKLTCIKQNALLMGKKAGQMILERIKDKEANPKEIVVVSDLVINGSVKKIN
jgi:LacI family transcriptional regulator